MPKTVNKEDILSIMKRNIKDFNRILKEDDERIIKLLSYFRRWYYIEGFGFGPSKYIGYRKQNIDKYLRLKQTDYGMDGRDTEKAIRELGWFKKTNDTKMVKRLESLFESHGKKPNALTTIHVLK